MGYISFDLPHEITAAVILISEREAFGYHASCCKILDSPSSSSEIGLIDVNLRRGRLIAPPDFPDRIHERDNHDSYFVRGLSSIKSI